MYKHIVFDVDGTLIDTESAILGSLQYMLRELRGEEREPDELRFALGIPSTVVMERLGVADTKRGIEVWYERYNSMAAEVGVFEGVPELLAWIKQCGYTTGIVTSKSRAEYEADFPRFNLEGYFDHVLCAGDTPRGKPSPDPLLRYCELAGAQPQEVLYIGDSVYDMQCAASAGAAGGLAVWGAADRHITTTHYFFSPAEVRALLEGERADSAPWLRLAKELQFIGQAGVAYSTDAFDRERFVRIREIAAEMLAGGSGQSARQVREWFCRGEGYETPKLDSRAAIIEGGKILLVQEQSGRWSLPGGWVDADQSVGSNTVKEVREEAGLSVEPLCLVALHDYKRHNPPATPWGITKAFVLCRLLGGEFVPNDETQANGWFAPDALPPLTEDRCTAAQILLCFEAAADENWQTRFD